MAQRSSSTTNTKIKQRLEPIRLAQGVSLSNYRRSFNSFARSSKPGLPSKANMFFLYLFPFS
ncbi:hypothetical protein D932_00569 [Enterococcus casseliflavus 14-MB-W-14]|nr:hypothetical protein D932_00569 [Enterococcus casseliflavus 14-MB-W-14]